MRSIAGRTPWTPASLFSWLLTASPRNDPLRSVCFTPESRPSSGNVRILQPHSIFLGLEVRSTSDSRRRWARSAKTGCDPERTSDQRAAARPKATLARPIRPMLFAFRPRGRVSHRQISPIKSGIQPIVPVQGRIRGRMPIVLPMSATGMSHLGTSGLNLYPLRGHQGMPETLGRIHSIHVQRSMTWQRTSNERP